MSATKTYRVMNTSTAFLEYLQGKDIKHEVTEDGKMTVFSLGCDTDLFYLGFEYCRDVD